MPLSFSLLAVVCISLLFPLPVFYFYFLATRYTDSDSDSDSDGGNNCFHFLLHPSVRKGGTNTKESQLWYTPLTHSHLSFLFASTGTLRPSNKYLERKKKVCVSSPSDSKYTLVVVVVVYVLNIVAAAATLL